MLWSFIAVFLSGWLYVDASYRGATWQRWLFKPLTLLLLLLLGWQAPLASPTGYLVLAGLVATLAGDALMLLPRQQLLYAFGAFFLSHLFWPLPLALLVIGAALIGTIWTRLGDLRWPICTYIGMTLVMVWLAGELYFFRPIDTSFSGFVGAVLLLLNAIVWLGSHYRKRFTADSAIAAACYFAGHFMIVRSLYL